MQGSQRVDIKRGSRRVNVLRLADYIKAKGIADIIVWLELKVKGRPFPLISSRSPVPNTSNFINLR